MKRLNILFFLILAVATSFAQQNEKHDGRKRFSPEDFKRKMEAFVTKEAGLTQQEAQDFFPLLHEMLEKQRDLNDQQRELMQSGEKNLSEAEYEKIIDKATNLEIENKKLERTYYKKFHAVLSWKKIHKTRCALFKFRMESLRHFAPPKAPKTNNTK